MQPVLDVPTTPCRMGEQLGVEWQGGQIAAPLQTGAAVALDFGLDHCDRAQAREAWLAWEPPGRDEPVHVVAHQVTTDFNAAVITVGCLEAAVDRGGLVVEVAPDLVVQAGLVVLGREQGSRRHGRGWFGRSWSGCPWRRW